MAKVTTFMYAANAVQEQVKEQGQGQGQGPMHIIAPLLTIVPLYIPSTFSFFVVFGIKDFETAKSHNLRVVFRNIKEPMKSLVEASVVIPPVPPDPSVKLPDNEKSFLSSLGFQNVVLESEGLYKTSIFFDDNNIGDYEVYVARKNNEKS
jgi:hypothetical protein